MKRSSLRLIYSVFKGFSEAFLYDYHLDPPSL